MSTSILTKLASFAPTIFKFIGVGGAPAKIETEIIDIAKAVTQAHTEDGALVALLADPKKAHEFQMAILGHTQRLEALYFDDMHQARWRDSLYLQMNRRNWRADGMFVLAVSVIMALVAIIWKEPDINEYAKGVFTFILGRFAGYLDNIYSFEFGSTRSSLEENKTSIKKDL